MNDVSDTSSPRLWIWFPSPLNTATNDWLCEVFHYKFSRWLGKHLDARGLLIVWSAIIGVSSTYQLDMLQYNSVFSDREMV